MISSSKFIGNKAGMSFIDKERVTRIIAENTSANFENYEKKQTGRIEEQIRKNRQRLDSLTEQQINQTREELDKVITEMEKWRRLDTIKMHIDMDAFFAAVECRDNVQLRDVPMAVGSLSMLSTSNYVARQFGVRSAMPGFIAKKLCPHLIIVPGNYSKYKQESAVFREVFRRYDPDVVMGSLDEAYLDITHFVSQRKEPVTCQRVRFMGPCVCRLPLVTNNSEIGHNVERIVKICTKCGKERVEVVDLVEFGQDVDSVVRQLRFEVEQATGLTCSAGIASNSMLAKICSDLNKPNGQFRLDTSRDAIVSFMRTLRVRKVPGIGAVTEALLKALGVETCGDLLEKRAIVHLLFSKHCSSWLLRVSLGISEGESTHEADDDNQKSISIERTFTPTNNLAELLSIVQSLSVRLINSLSSSDIAGGRAVTLKIKFANFDVVTRCKSVTFVVTTVDQLLPIMEALLCKELKERRNMAIRLLGVRLSQLVSVDNLGEEPKKGIQLSLTGFVLRRPFTNKKLRTEPPELVELSSSSDESDIRRRTETTENDEKREKPMPQKCHEWEKDAASRDQWKSGELNKPNGGVPDKPSVKACEHSQNNDHNPSCSALMEYDKRSDKREEIITVENDDDDNDEGIVNIDEYFDFYDDDTNDVIECNEHSVEEKRRSKEKNSRGGTAKEGGGERKRKKRKRKSEPKEGRKVDRKTNNLYTYFNSLLYFCFLNVLIL